MSAARGPSAARVEAVAGTDDGPLVVRIPHRTGQDAAVPGAAGASRYLFEGSLGELAHALRVQRLEPRQVDLMDVVRLVLARFEAFAARDLERATDALPPAAAVVELKARMLLPRPPRPALEEDEAAREEALEAVAALEALEAAIEELRLRREHRRRVLPARAPTPPYPRPTRGLGVPLGRLAELASRLQPGAYFEIVRDRLTVTAALARILERLRPGRRQPFEQLMDEAGWATRTVYFVAALELARDGRCRLYQDAAFAPIEVEGSGGAP